MNLLLPVLIQLVIGVVGRLGRPALAAAEVLRSGWAVIALVVAVLVLPESPAVAAERAAAAAETARGAATGRAERRPETLASAMMASTLAEVLKVPQVKVGRLAAVLLAVVLELVGGGAAKLELFVKADVLTAVMGTASVVAFLLVVGGRLESSSSSPTAASSSKSSVEEVAESLELVVKVFGGEAGEARFDVVDVAEIALK